MFAYLSRNLLPITQIKYIHNEMFEWDPAKARTNKFERRVSFEEAATSLLTPRGLDGEDLEHSVTEARRCG
jgi:uncharacterized DUF497 family protein